MPNPFRSALSAIMCLAFVFGTLVKPAQAQRPITLSDDASISLITVYPGNQAYNLFGHSALRVRDPYHGFDLMYNYGTFQFDYLFVPKFIYGQLDYMLWVSDIRRELQHYRSEGRSVIEQMLTLNQEQKQAVFNFIQHNALEENRTYRYDFLFDNCSTRIRDVFENIIGDSLSFPNINDNLTFRELLDPYIQSYPFLDAGIDLGLGMPTDQIATSRDEMFLPLHLMEAFDEAQIITDSTQVPLVGEKATLYWTNPEEKQANLAPLYITTWLIFLLALWVSNGKSEKAAVARKWFDRVLFGVTGFAGLLALFLWVIAIHKVTNYNWNLLWAWPTHLAVLAVLSKGAGWLRPYMRVNAFVVFITILGWFFWPQDMHEAFIPLLLAIAVRSIWWGWRNPSMT